VYVVSLIYRRRVKCNITVDYPHINILCNRYGILRGANVLQDISLFVFQLVVKVMLKTVLSANIGKLFYVL